MAAQHVDRGEGEDLAAALRVRVADLDRLANLLAIGAEQQWYTLCPLSPYGQLQARIGSRQPGQIIGQLRAEAGIQLLMAVTKSQ